MLATRTRRWLTRIGRFAFFEFELALRHRARRIVRMTDEARATGVLRELSDREGGRYASFREQPFHHWWPGNEIGIAVIGNR